MGRRAWASTATPTNTATSTAGRIARSSLLGIEAIERVQADGHPDRARLGRREPDDDGIELSGLPIGTRLAIGDRRGRCSS